MVFFYLNPNTFPLRYVLYARKGLIFCKTLLKSNIMRKLLFFTLICLIGMPAFAQLNCSSVSASISLSASGAVATLTNSSTPTATSNIYTTYHITWGDGSSPTWKYNNSSATHTYGVSGTYSVRLISTVFDSVNRITCHDTDTKNVTVTVPALNCNSVNASMNRSSNGLNVWITNTSTPAGNSNIKTYYSINWGDGSSSGSYSTNTPRYHAYNANGTYTIKLYLVVTDSSNNITCQDTATSTVTLTGPPRIDCDSVKAAMSLSANGLVATLTNTSTVNTIVPYQHTSFINWGDGSTTGPVAGNSTQTHTYATGGMYNVVLRYTVTDTINNITCVDSVYQVVTVTSLNRIRGYVVPDSQLHRHTDSFKIWLITFDSSTNILAAVDSQVISAAGNMMYSFSNHSAGNYRVKAALHNGPTSGTTMVPTYHTSSILWNNATVIAHNGGTTQYKNIFMKVGTATTGPGFVGGNVTQGANKGTSAGIEGMNIFLMDANGNLIAFTQTDANGDYEFNNLPMLTYLVYPESLAYNTSPAVVTIANNNLNRNAIHFERSTKNMTIKPKTTGIDNVNTNSLSFAVYPNPAKNTININWAKYTQDEAQVVITDISGKKVYNANVTMNANANINISNLQSGLYFINIATESGSNTQKLVVE